MVGQTENDFEFTHTETLQVFLRGFLVTSIWNHWSPFIIKKFPIPFLEIFLKSNDKGALDYAKKAKGIKIVTSK